jgi:hypothetical protein
MKTNLSSLEQWVDDAPADLRQSLGESTLVKLALDAARTVAAQKPWLSGPGEAQPDPQMLLALLTYCYAASIYGSQEIEFACQDDPAVRSICANARPDWRTLWCFRNANRPWIEECLARVYGAASATAPTTASREAAPVPTIETEAPPGLIAFARRKLRHAVWADAAMFD